LAQAAHEVKILSFSTGAGCITHKKFQVFPLAQAAHEVKILSFSTGAAWYQARI
jgi:hypothetical protein